MVKISFGFKIRNIFLKVCIIFGKDFLLGFCFRWCKIWNEYICIFKKNILYIFVYKSVIVYENDNKLDSFYIKFIMVVLKELFLYGMFGKIVCLNDKLVEGGIDCSFFLVLLSIFSLVFIKVKFFGLNRRKYFEKFFVL